MRALTAPRRGVSRGVCAACDAPLWQPPTGRRRRFCSNAHKMQCHRQQAALRMQPLFYLGTHEVTWLAQTTVPLFISHHRLQHRRRLPRARCAWALDSGAFTALSTGPATMPTARDYLAAVNRYARDVGGLQWAAPLDWMCESAILARTGLSVREHQERTVASVLELRALATSETPPIIPVLQGWTLDDYLRCMELYAYEGIRLADEPLVGLGSVCRRQNTDEICAIVTALADRGLRLHGFGVKTGGLGRYGRHLVSCDSLAWSFRARYRPPMRGHRHATCVNCLRFALAHRRVLLRSVVSSLDVRETRDETPPLAGEAA